MDALERELNELKGFVADLKNDRATQKEKEKREAWTKYTSLSVVFIAVLAAISSQWSGKYSGRVLAELNDSTYNQALASDQWAFYQSKSIKQNFYEMAHEQLEANPAQTEPALVKLKEKLAARIERYDKEKKDIQVEAKRLVELRDASRKASDLTSKKGAGMGLAVSIFQISIAMGSICLVTKKKMLWYLALALAAAGTIEMVQVLRL